MDLSLLKKLGFSDKDSVVYSTLLTVGPSSVRQLAERSELNRGVVYESLKWLQEQELVDFYEKENKQYFVAENPEKLAKLLESRTIELKETARRLENSLPELRSLYNRGGEQPVARYYDQSKLSVILEDVLLTCEKRGEPLYRIYSTAGIREYLYDNFPTFSDVRVAKGIKVKVIAIGKGGELRGLDERKWLKEEGKTPTYVIIYPGKTAYISLNAKREPVGVVVENEGISETQTIIFETLWQQL